MAREHGAPGESGAKPAPGAKPNGPNDDPEIRTEAGAAGKPAAGEDAGKDGEKQRREPPDDRALQKNFPLSALRTNGRDKRDRRVLDVLWAVEDFKIYKTAQGISPHFSDDPETAREQRNRYLALGSELARVNLLIDLLPRPVALDPGRWRATLTGAGAEPLHDRARAYYERELARGIAQALLGQPEQGKETLAALAGRLEKRLRNRGRVAYFGMCLGLAVGIALLASYALAWPVGLNLPELSLAAIMGSLGAVLSTAAGLRSLQLDASAMSVMNFVYGVQRMIVGVLGAVVLYLAMRAGVVLDLLPFAVETGQATAGAGADAAGTAGAGGAGAGGADGGMQPLDHYKLAFLSVLAGFSERLVPNLLDRNANGNGEGGPPTGGAHAPVGAEGRKPVPAADKATDDAG